MNHVGAASFTERIVEDEADLRSVRVLIVEDDPCCREALALNLEERGARVIAVDSVQAALQCFEPAPPNLLISDIEMPGLDGFDLIQQVRALDARHRRHTPAIAVTGLCIRDARDTVCAAGFDEHLPKPLDLDILVERIRALVGC